MVTVPSESQGSGDNELLDAVRHGSTDAYAELYDRHVGAAYSMARQVAQSPSEADDLVSETFAKVLDALRSGGGPTSAFRAYLLTSLRHTAYDRTRRDKKLQLSEDVTTVPGVDGGESFVDPAVTGLERSLAAQAFARLPERWQAVLWHIEIEGQKPADVAPLLGLTPNGVSALAYRAREGLRQAYLQGHLGHLADAGPGVEQCRATVERLGSWTRGGLAKRETAQVESHLDGCERCRTLAAELADVNGGLRSVIAPLVLGAGAAGYLAATQGSTTLAAGTAGAATGGAGAAGAASGEAGAAGATTELASTSTRQVLTAAASGVALVTAVALGVTSGEQPQPSAQPGSEPVQPAPAPVPEPPNPPAPQPPGAPPQSPAPPEQPPQQSPAPNPPAPQPPASTPDRPPAPEPASLSVSGPSGAVQLVAGESEKPMPVRVTNTGGSESEPVTASLTLPSGITASVPQVRAASAPSIRCDGGNGSITCTTDRGLGPGSSIEFGFVVRADHNAEDGEVTGTVSAGTGSELSLAAIQVAVVPQPTDEVDVRASEAWSAGPFGRVHLEMTNTGTTSAPAEMVARVPEDLRIVGSHGCQTSSEEVRCRTGQLPPGKEFERSFMVTTLADGGEDRGQVRPAASGWPPERAFTIPVSGALGTANDTASADMALWGPWLPPEEQPAPPPAPTSDPTTSPDPTTTSPDPTTPDPTTSPDPTTTSPDPTTSDPPDPTTTSQEPTTSNPPDPTTTSPDPPEPTTSRPTDEPTTGPPNDPTTSRTGAPTTGSSGGSTGDTSTQGDTPGSG